MSFYDYNVRHAIYIERYKKRLVRDILAKIDDLTGSLFNQVAASDLEGMTRKELSRLMARLNRVVGESYVPITEQINDALKEFAVYEAESTARAATRIGLDLAVPSDADLWAAMYSRPFQGKLLREWLTDLAPNTAARVRQTIRQGYVDGRGALDIARDIRGTRTRKGVMDISRRGAETMARTAVSHTASAARTKTYARNSEIIGEQWISVLDHRTSAICWGRDGIIYPLGKGPRPPAHPNCRSATIPVTPNNRAALRSRPKYNDWLIKQPKAVQQDVLGVKRAKLFRDGGYTVDRFTDKSGSEYTLDELRAKDRETFDELFAE